MRLLALLASLILTLPASGQLPGVAAEELDRLYGSRVTPEARAYQKAGPSVVHVEVYRRLSMTLDDLTELAKDPERLLSQLEKESEGSGVIIDRRGFVITNAHVAVPDLGEEFADIYCRLSFAEEFGGGVYWANVVDVDYVSDLGLLKIASNERFQALPLRQTNDLLIGERVIAIGSARGMSHTVTSGILSGIHRDITVQASVPGPFGISQTVNRELKGLVQTDAAINLGNSGGPLLNVHGELIGINAATLLSADGMGYAIPADRVREVLEQRLFALKGWLGISMSGTSLEIETVHPRGPAFNAGLRVGDVLHAVNGSGVTDLSGFQREMVLFDPQDPVRFDFSRGGQPRTAEVKLAPLPARDTVGLLGFEGRPWQVRTEGGLRSVIQITEVYEGTGAAELGLLPGDLVVAVHLVDQANDGWRPVSTLPELAELVRGPDFDFGGLNLWWIVADRSRSLKGQMEFDDPTLKSDRGATAAGN